jgi:transcriptional regulator GlxA family with amidase domain
MTIAPEIVIVTFPSAQILDVTGPLEVFSSASRFLPTAMYRAHVVSCAGDAILASCGLEFATTPIAGVRTPIDTLVVAGGANMDDAAGDAELVHHVQRLAAGARRGTSGC